MSFTTIVLYGDADQTAWIEKQLDAAGIAYAIISDRNEKLDKIEVQVSHADARRVHNILAPLG